MRRGYNKPALFDAIALGYAEGLGSVKMARLLGCKRWYAREIRAALGLPARPQRGPRTAQPSEALMRLVIVARQRLVNHVDASGGQCVNRIGVGEVRLLKPEAR